jgi:polar amino acid transport system substrate-binding protein
MTLRFCVLLGLFCLAAQAMAAEPLRLCYEDVPQGYWTRPDGSGVALDLMRKVESRLGERFVYTSLPWKRCLEEVRIGTMDAVIGAADSPERHAFAVFPTQPDGSVDSRTAIWTDYFNVFYRSDSKVKWDGKDLHVPSGTVMAQRSYVVGEILRSRGFKVVEPSKSVMDGLRLLAAGGIEAAVLQGVEAEWLCANDARFRGLIRQGATRYAVLPLYFMPARPSYDRDPKRMQAIWGEIRTVRESAEYRKLEEAAARSYRGN